MTDVSAALSNPDICQGLIILRTTGAMGNDGRFHPMLPPTPINMIGSVQVADPKTLDQVPQGDRTTGAKVVYSTAPIYVTRDEGLSDELLHDGQLYRVQKVWDWSQYGYWKVYAVRMSGS